MMTFDVVNILERLGYPITIRGNNCVCPTIYRGGDNPLGLFVNESGICHDQITKQNFHLVDLVSAVLECSPSDAKKFIGSNQGVAPKKVAAIEMAPEFDLRDIQNLTPSFKFYNDRGISNDTLNTFKAGLCHGGKYNLRICFPIFDKERIIGVAARDAVNRDPAKKWKLSKKQDFVYPLFVSKPHILEQRSVVLVESIGDMLNLWENGVRNVLVIFGLSLTKRMEMALVALNPAKILISLNRDENNRGQLAAAKLKDKLSHWFNKEILIDAPPFKNDFGDMNAEEIQQWKIKYGQEENRIKI